IPTTVTLTPPAGVRAGPVEYPRPVERRLKFGGETTLLLYDGTVRFTATLEGAPAAGSGRLEAALRFQACDDSRCLPPRTLELVAALDPPAPLGAAEPPAGGQDQAAGWGARWGYPLTFLWGALVGVALHLTPARGGRVARPRAAAPLGARHPRHLPDPRCARGAARLPLRLGAPATRRPGRDRARARGPRGEQLRLLSAARSLAAHAASRPRRRGRPGRLLHGPHHGRRRRALHRPGGAGAPPLRRRAAVELGRAHV